MNEIDESCAENDSSSPFIGLSDELVLQISNKLIDLKTLCIFHLVSKRFSPIVVQADTVCLYSLIGVDTNIFNGELSTSLGETFKSKLKFLKKFTKLKSLYILHEGVDNSEGFKWKINFGTRVDSFVFLSPNSIYITHTNTNGVNESEVQNVEDEAELSRKKEKRAHQCLICATSMVLFMGMFVMLVDNPLLEYVSSTFTWGTVCFDSRGKVSQAKEWILSADVAKKILLFQISHRISRYYVPLLELPVSGYIMKGVTMILVERDDLHNNSFMPISDDKEDGFEQDKEEAAYDEAMIEIYKKHKAQSIERVFAV